VARAEQTNLYYEINIHSLMGFVSLDCWYIYSSDCYTSSDCILVFFDFFFLERFFFRFLGLRVLLAGLLAVKDNGVRYLSAIGQVGKKK